MFVKLLFFVKRKKELPKAITFSFASYIFFYHTAKKKEGNVLVGVRNGENYEIKDDDWILNFYLKYKNSDNTTLVKSIIDNENMWGETLKKLSGFKEKVIEDLDLIDRFGMNNAIKQITNNFKTII